MLVIKVLLESKIMKRIMIVFVFALALGGLSDAARGPLQHRGEGASSRQDLMSPIEASTHESKRVSEYRGYL